MLGVSWSCKITNLNQNLLSLIEKCKSMLELKQLHAVVISFGLSQDEPFISKILWFSALSNSGDINYSYRVFSQLSSPTIFNWNTIIRGYSNSKIPVNSLGEMVTAQKVFDSMLEKDVRSWSSLINGYVKVGEYSEAMSIFEKMRAAGPEANEVTMVSVSCACAHLGALEKGKMIHKHIVDCGLPLTLVLQTSLVDMYAKCGAIEEALLVFRRVSKSQTDVLIWNAMIGGLATHGLVEESLKLFKEMQTVGIQPDEVTYLCLLAACAHGGLVREAWHFFENLNKCGMTPTIEHYACMVDVLARANQLTTAYQFICRMPIEPTAAMLGALLSGCINHRNLALAETVGKKLIELEPNHDGRYIGLSNVYAVDKRWDDARSMREAMDRRGVKKSPGFSFVEISGVLHRFIAHDKAHPDSEETYCMLNFVVRQMKCSWYKDKEKSLKDTSMGDDLLTWLSF
ncbi:hypothetical protein V8G54_030313 [Vigna mungo]|uniref:Pentatricopeptide repeat-containing protein n=1 Tax=Vigna mungo TaxID=3915 RepID=A0AAQ3MVD3_VIGMU